MIGIDAHGMMVTSTPLRAGQGKLYQDDLFATGVVKKHYFFDGKLVAMHGGGYRFLLTYQPSTGSGQV